MRLKINKLLLLPGIVILISCNNAPKTEQQILVSDSVQEIQSAAQESEIDVEEKMDYDTANWVDIALFIPDIVLDIKYATDDNFTKKQIYDCPRCLLRKDAGKALKKAFEAVVSSGFGMKVFDCYRPAPYQQRLWDVMPDKRYVAPPSKGSMHSRGGAVDLTLIDPKTLKEVDMGTPYDYFGREAHPAYQGLPDSTLYHRQLLSNSMVNAGFRPITSEWWHFDYGSSAAKLEDFLWDCK